MAPVMLSPLRDANLFDSFFMGGFEAATHVRRDRRRLDVVRDSCHDVHAGRDYRALAAVGVRTVRDSMRWHRIEVADGIYDWSSLLPMLDAARRAGVQVIWDICHWGVPAGIDIFSPEFVARFARFASAAAQVVREHSDGVPIYCPINEMSFWAWVGGDEQHFAPFARGRGLELKQQFVRAGAAATEEVRRVDPRARFVQAEPAIYVHPSLNRPWDVEPAAAHTAAQFEAWDMLAEAGALDLLGVNFYWNNQWVLGQERAALGHGQHRPLHTILELLWERYQRPIVITETGAEDANLIGWMAYVCSEVRMAWRRGVPVLGVCIYPVMDYNGWDDGRHCPCGLIEIDAEWRERRIRTEAVEELAIQARMLRPSPGPELRIEEPGTSLKFA